MSAEAAFVISGISVTLEDREAVGEKEGSSEDGCTVRLVGQTAGK